MDISRIDVLAVDSALRRYNTFIKTIETKGSFSFKIINALVKGTTPGLKSSKNRWFIFASHYDHMM